MESVGEVISLGRSFAEAIQKAVRMVKENYLGVLETDVARVSEREMEKATEGRMFCRFECRGERNPQIVNG